ncbi:uncharacterized protein EHS24_002941 [Apiotrichum porosum]|uniref:FAD-binding domain-containing protein n=1 Tax=Apiotrichum porosum TaxID=105984 RepID=A0A427XG58_9TREE|nr:uncharacterized protein EHS24_002941 [Apiotrichum porosum]RSH77875.1 hypothetical protein EHS24_002941 [Apiotrichum porosum]
MRSKVLIVDSGISGFVLSITLADIGAEVAIHERLRAPERHNHRRPWVMFDRSAMDILRSVDLAEPVEFVSEEIKSRPESNVESGGIGLEVIPNPARPRRVVEDSLLRAFAYEACRRGATVVPVRSLPVMSRPENHNTRTYFPTRTWDGGRPDLDNELKEAKTIGDGRVEVTWANGTTSTADVLIAGESVMAREHTSTFWRRRSVKPVPWYNDKNMLIFGDSSMGQLMPVKDAIRLGHCMRDFVSVSRALAKFRRGYQPTEPHTFDPNATTTSFWTAHSHLS